MNVVHELSSLQHLSHVICIIINNNNNTNICKVYIVSIRAETAESDFYHTVYVALTFI